MSEKAQKQTYGQLSWESPQRGCPKNKVFPIDLDDGDPLDWDNDSESEDRTEDMHAYASSSASTTCGDETETDVDEVSSAKHL